MNPVRRSSGVHSYLILSNSPALRNPFAESSESSSSSGTLTSAGSSAQSYEANVGFKAGSSANLQYQVQHGYFRWTIENFSEFPPVNDKYCLSPIFNLKEIWWYLTLHPRAKIYGRDHISLNLIRHKSDRGPKTVRVSYRLGLESGTNKIWFRPEENVIFAYGDCYGFQTSIFGHLEDFLEDGVMNHEDTLSVLCEMYVSYALDVNNATSPSRKKTSVDTELPSKLVSLYKTEELNDVLIEVPTVRVRAHRSVLSARSMTLARMLEGGKSFIQLSCTASCLYCVLLYMYSANFNFMAKNVIFSIGLYELACELSLNKLRDLLTPHNIELKSKITIDNFITEWTLHKFEISDLFSQNMESGIYFDKATGIGVTISFQKVVSHETVEVLVKVSGIVAAIDFSFEMYLLDEDSQPVGTIPAIFSQDSRVEFRNLIFTYSVHFSVSDIIRCGLFDGNLYIICVCQRHSLVHLVEDYIPTITEPLDSSTWLEDLSADLRELFISGHLSDITVVLASGQSFKLHRSILAARSTRFHKLFLYERFKNQVLVLDRSEVHSRTLELMFTYMYTGTLRDRPDITRADILEMYLASELFSVNSLRIQCEKYLIRALDPNFADEVLIAADHFENSQLAEACREYLRIHFGVQDVSSTDTDSGSEED